MLRYIGGDSSFGEYKSVDNWGRELREYRVIRAKGYSTFDQFRINVHTLDSNLKEEYTDVLGWKVFMYSQYHYY